MKKLKNNCSGGEGLRDKAERRSLCLIMALLILTLKCFALIKIKIFGPRDCHTE